MLALTVLDYIYTHRALLALRVLVLRFTQITIPFQKRRNAAPVPIAAALSRSRQ